MIFTQAVPMTGGIVIVGFAFKFALLAELNQGCIPCMFALTSIYVSVIFYFKFGERISRAQICGIGLMIPCAVLLSLDQKDAADSENDLTASEMQKYGVYAVLLASSAPFLWTFRTYHLRCAIEYEKFPVHDYSIDQMFF